MSDVSAGAIAGAVIGGFLGCLLLLWCCYVGLRRCRGRQLSVRRASAAAAHAAGRVTATVWRSQVLRGLDGDERRFRRRLETQMRVVDAVFDAADQADDAEDALDERDLEQLRLLERELAKRKAAARAAAAADGGVVGAAAANGATAPRLPAAGRAHTRIPDGAGHANEEAPSARGDGDGKALPRKPSKHIVPVPLEGSDDGDGVDAKSSPPTSSSSARRNGSSGATGFRDSDRVTPPIDGGVIGSSMGQLTSAKGGGRAGATAARR